ncbi:MAG: twin-arginine translocase subunit TatC [Lentimicrobiaceae bacterium]|jgi:sec-independent protein translocase protein TatC|nr:twin-arginine translocase subunit TatC [Lentimicrobiaceae bacterium]
MTKKLTFWDHLDELRAVLIRIAVVTVVFGIAAFFFKDFLFNIIFAPKNDDFIIYKILQRITKQPSEFFFVKLINTGLADQFVTHMKVALYAGFLCSSPYILYQLFRFVSPALYRNERKYTARVVFSSYVMFVIGILLSYFVVFPLTFRFLGTYQVSSEVENMISLHSYINTMMMLCLMMGIIFEIPILCWLFAKLGMLSSAFMTQYRKHAIVILLVIAAIITPTADVFTLLLVSIPMYLLFEISILIVRKVEKK